MGTLRSLAATGDRARGFLKHRDTENTERKNEGEEERRRGRTKGGRTKERKNDAGKRGLGIKRWARRVGGKKSGGSR
jgi:hypothetical protein